MTFRALAENFSGAAEFPIKVKQVFSWIRENTDHKNIELHGVSRDHKSYRGAFRRRAISTRPYDPNPDILTQILFGTDLTREWKRLVIVKEVTHVFDGPNACVETPEKLQSLIPSIITTELKGAPFVPAINDHFGAFKAMAVLMPRSAREQLSEAVSNETRTVEEVAQYVRLPESYVDIWLQFGDKLDALLYDV